MPATPAPLARLLVAAACALPLTLGAADFEARPLAPPSKGDGKTLFTLMPAASTGIIGENEYTDPLMWGRLYQEFTVGAVGTGVAISDYDGDGRPDIYIVSKTERARLFRNLGEWRFQDVTNEAGLDDDPKVWKQGAAFADVNNDGWPDLYLCRFNAPNLLYMNQGNGRFREEGASRGLALVDASGMGAFADYDRDGDLDVYVQTNLLDVTRKPGGQRDYLLRNDGTGHFTDVSAQSGMGGESQGHSATWWDYNNDGWPGLYVANDFEAPDWLYRNNGDGSFGQVAGQVLPRTPYSAMGSDLGDVDNDGRIDLLVADMAATTHEKDQRGMAHSRARSTEDNPGNGFAPSTLRNTLYLNKGVDRMQEAAHLAGLAATDWTWSVRFEDLDNDGRVDLHVTNGMVRELHNADLLTRIMNAVTPAERVSLMRNSPPLAERNLAYQNRGDLTFAETGKAWGLDQMGVSFGAAFGDLDGDGDLDLVYTNYEAGPTVLRNDSETGNRLTLTLEGAQSNKAGLGASVELEGVSGNQIRQLVSARGYLSSSEPLIHFGLGADERVTSLTIRWPSGTVQTLKDIAANQHLHVKEKGSKEVHPLSRALFQRAKADPALDQPSREGVVDETAIQPLLPKRHHRRGPALAVADVNRDGFDDLAIGGTSLDPLRVLSGTTSGQFVSLWTATASPIPLDDGPLAFVDLNGDDAPDLIQTRGGANLPGNAAGYQPKVWLNDGKGVFSPAAKPILPPAPISVGAMALADFDRDGELDLFLGARLLPGKYPLAPKSTLLRKKDEAYVEVTAELAPGLAQVGLVTAALWTDVDADGWADLLVATEWGPVRAFRNESGTSFSDHTDDWGFATADKGWWSSLAAGDFNRDGRMDYVAGNLGLNTPYRASAEEPALLYQGGKAAGAPQLVEAYSESGVTYPRRTRKQLLTVFPQFAKQFPNNDTYAKASLSTLIPSGTLEAMTRLEATQLQSGVFLSQPRGGYVFHALPRVAQIAPAQGMVVGDFDGDGNLDLFIAQNSLAPVPSVGAFDGGLGQLLRGNGQGEWRAMEPAESGLAIPGDAKAAIATDLDHNGSPDLLVTRNNSTPLAFTSTTDSPERLQIRLVGKVGNRNAVGTVVVAHRSDGTQERHEVYSHSGYYSQPSAVLNLAGGREVRPVAIDVHWPDGTQTNHSIPSDVKTIEIPQP